MIDELAAVIRMKAQNEKRKLFEHIFQNGQQPRFADLLRPSHYLPLRHLIHCVNLVHPFDAVSISLMHGVHSLASLLN